MKANTIWAIGAVITTLLSVALRAEVGGDNPTGITGQFNGNVSTGCSYDPYTANATRSITDLVIAGGVGEYPLAFTRTMNSRRIAGLPNEFGKAGNWRHSYQWSIDPAPVTKTGSVGRPTAYNVNYPDGRRVIFSNRNTGDPDFRGVAGVRDRFEQLTGSATECYLLLSDGGRVSFHAFVQTTVSNGIYTSVYTFRLTGIIDPYNQKTSIGYPDDLSMLVTEPTGKWLKLFYRKITSGTEGVVGETVLNYVQGIDNRKVYYTYVAYVVGTTRYTSLAGVKYFPDSNGNNPEYTATYTYQNGNVDPKGPPLISTCEDPMFDGPMWKIAYQFVAYASGVVNGQLFREKNPNGTVVSALNVINATRTEVRGDILADGNYPSRTFIYNGYKLKVATDFKNVSATQTYDANNYLSSVTDRNGNSTTYVSNPLNGNPDHILYPISNDIVPPGVQTKVHYLYGSSDCADPNNRDESNPYYVCSEKTGNETVAKTYFRDASKRIIRIEYLDNRNEYFNYNTYGQIVNHTLRNGGIEQYFYGAYSRVTAYWDAEHPTSGHPTAWYQYDSLGRVKGITDGRGAQNGDPAYTTTFTYNTRGQLIRLTHPDPGNTYIQYGYNSNGTLAWTADERHPVSPASPDLTQSTSYTYDDYKRLRTITTLSRGVGDATPRMTTYFYTPTGTGENYSRTASVPIKVVSPGGSIVLMSYDLNLRNLVTTALGDSNVPNASTTYSYDNNGNVRTVTDPNGQATGATTTYAYDRQNRVSSITDPIVADRNANNHTMDFYYDPSGNKVKAIRADNAFCSYEYNLMGRLKIKTGYGTEVTSYTPDYNGNNTSIEVPGGKIYNYVYDFLDRVKTVTYPVDYSGTSRTETYIYDIANHLSTYKNPAGQIKTLTYDSRGRLVGSSWNPGTGPAVTVTYDATRPTGILTLGYIVAGINVPATNTVFGYDEANNRTYEDQVLSGFPARRVQTDPDADGNRQNLLVKTGATVNFATSFDYTSRNELLNIYDANHSLLFTYDYDASGNVSLRRARQLGAPPARTALQYDALNRPTYCGQYAPDGTVAFAAGHYHYRKTGNLHDTTRDEEGGKGDWFAYDEINQLTTAQYSASNVTGDSPTSPAKTVSYVLGAKNRQSMNVNGAPTTYTHNDLSQFTVINGLPLQYDYNFNLTNYNGRSYVYDAENRLISASDNHQSAQFVYDGVGRCVKRTINGVVTLLTYDQWTPIAEWDGSGALAATNVYGVGGDEILYRSTPSGSIRMYYESDPMGNVRFLFSAAGTGIEKYSYDAFGKATITSWSDVARGTSAYGNRFMYGGREYFSSLGFYDMRNRIYDPTMGRFYQTDPTEFQGDSTNLYRFCGHNPLLGGDPTGLGSGDFVFSLPGSNDVDITSGLQFSDGFSIGGLTIEFGVSSDLEGLGGMNYTIPARASMTSGAGSSGEPASTQSRGVGQPSFLGGLAPLYGNGRSSLDYFQNGRWVMGTVFGAMTVADAFSLGTDSVIIDGFKGAVRGIGRLVPKAGVRISERGLGVVESHISFIEAAEGFNDVGNKMMIDRLRGALAKGDRLFGADANYYLHEAYEATYMKRLMSQGMDYRQAYEIVHPQALGKFGVSEFELYHADVIRANPQAFGPPFKAFIGLDP